MGGSESQRHPWLHNQFKVSLGYRRTWLRNSKQEQNTKRPKLGWKSKEEEVGFTRGKKERLMPPPALRCTHSQSSVVFTQSLLIKLQKLPFYLSALLFQSDLKRENECHSGKLMKEAANSIGDLKHGKTAHMVASSWAKSGKEVGG